MSFLLNNFNNLNHNQIVAAATSEQNQLTNTFTSNRDFQLYSIGLKAILNKNFDQVKGQLPKPMRKVLKTFNKVYSSPNPIASTAIKSVINNRLQTPVNLNPQPNMNDYYRLKMQLEQVIHECIMSIIRNMNAR